ncbi:MAG: acetyltransferase [Candidatus Entotheonella factor]|uniref:Acetyltransferase n=1 Tax=Entotheonella factor TaxID=1429438 RepID=W4L4J8_ENTF1|nr:MAG: acetyltransferase [Candidatus Entotheonella factor]
MRTAVTTYYLEMLQPAWLNPSSFTLEGVEIVQARIPCPELNRFLYTAVGGDWFWIDRLPWTYEQWSALLSRPGYETWMALVQGTPAGYFELDAQANGHVELAYFGLLPQFIGQGLGSHLLTAAIERAWQKDASRVWVHTCTLDHPNALENYQRRGFQIYKEEVTYEEFPDQSPGPWDGANKPIMPS